MGAMFSLMEGGEDTVFIRYPQRPYSGLVKIRCPRQRLVRREAAQRTARQRLSAQPSDLPLRLNVLCSAVLSYATRLFKGRVLIKHQ